MPQEPWQGLPNLVAATSPTAGSAQGGTSLRSLVAADMPLVAARDGLTALVGGAQAGTALTVGINRFTTVASAADSAQLPASVAGTVVINAAAANSMNVFPQTGDIINALAANAAFAVAANKTATFYCAVAGRWNAQLSA
jgi:uncharacterized protein (DUF2126 family)